MYISYSFYFSQPFFFGFLCVLYNTPLDSFFVSLGKIQILFCRCWRLSLLDRGYESVTVDLTKSLRCSNVYSFFFLFFCMKGFLAISGFLLALAIFTSCFEYLDGTFCVNASGRIGSFASLDYKCTFDSANPQTCL